jgi:hypothetical protein
MKGYTDFAMGFLGAEAVATKPVGDMKYMDWHKVKKIVEENPNAVIYAGLMENWGHTSGLIFAKGKYYDGYVHGSSTWATPIVDVDGEEIECWTYEKTEEGSDKPTWWGNGEKLLDAWEDEDEEQE